MNDAPQHPLVNTKDLLYHALQQLQTIHDTQRGKAERVTIELPTFAKTLQQKWEQVKVAQHITPTTIEDSPVLSTLKKIQASITILDQKYEDIQTKITEAPKTYAEIIKSTSSKESKVERQTQQRKQCEILRQERAKYDVTLTMKNIKAKAHQSITVMSGKAIAEHCQQAINRVCFNNTESPHIIGVSKLANSIRLQFQTEEEAKTVRSLHKTQEDNWSAAFEGLKFHEPMYGIVVHGVPIADLDPTKMSDTGVIKRLEMENNMKAGTITKITPLGHKPKWNDPANHDNSITPS